MDSRISSYTIAGMKWYFHTCSKGLESEILFASEKEFIAGMNRIAVCYLLSKKDGDEVLVIAFCLMDNHWHFILYGTEEACWRFVRRYKKLTSMWITEHRGIPLVEAPILGVWPIPNEKIADKIAYVLRNPVAAGMGIQPAAYRWSSASLMFSQAKPGKWGRRNTENISMKGKRRIGYTRQQLPDSWVVGPDSLIWPGNYVSIRIAERFYGALGKFMFALNNSNVDKDAEMEMMDGGPSIVDGEIKAKALALAQNDYGKRSINDCNSFERVAIAKTLKKEFGCNAKQLARVVQVNLQELKLVL